MRRNFSHDEQAILIAQSNLASLLEALARHEESLVLKREVFARCTATLGASHEQTISTGLNVSSSLYNLELWDEAISLARELLPPARRMGADQHLTLCLSQNLAMALRDNPESTRGEPRTNQRRGDATRL